MKFNRYGIVKNPLNPTALRDPVLSTTVFAFAVAAFLVGGTHEPWADEAQAWLIARDATLYDILFLLPHGEGNPSLWHLMLILPSAYFGYDAIKYVSLFFATLGVLVFIYYAPFPKPIKVILPFTYFVFFHYAVISKNYCLFALVIFSIGALHKKRFEKPLFYSALVALLAHTHSFGALISVGLIGLHFLDLLKEKHRLSKGTIIRSLACIGIPIGAIGFLLYQVFPVRHRTLSDRWYLDFEFTLNVLETSLKESFTGITLLSLLIFLISVFWFWQRKALVMYLALITPLLTLLSVKGFAEWHLGLFFLLWLVALWISFESNATSRAPSLIPYTRKLILGCIYVVFGFHIYWTGTVSYADYNGNYSCGKDVAQLLKRNSIGERRVYARNYWSIATLPYFEDKMFYNINPGSDFGYWTWFEPDKVDDMSAVLASRPDALVLTRGALETDFEGYVERIFKAEVYYKDRTIESNTCTVYIRKDLFIGDI